MNDRRTLLGFLLIGLIFVLAPYYYEWMGISPKPSDPIFEEKPPEARDQEEVGRSREVSSPPLEGLQAKGRVAALEPSIEGSNNSSFVSKIVKVETPLYDLEFDSKGGLLVSANLKKYSLVDGQSVQLVNVNSQALGLSLRHFNGYIERLSEIEFKPDRDRLEVHVGNESLVLNADLGDGRFVAKELKFYADSYGFDCVLKYRGFSEDVDAELAWEGGIPFTEELIEYDLPEMGALASFNGERIEVKVDDGESSSWSDQAEGALRRLRAARANATSGACVTRRT